MAITKTQCKNCDKIGLPLLLVRPSAISTESGFAPAGADAVQTNEKVVRALSLPAFKKNRPILRLLRSGGFVYVYAPESLSRPWRTYQVMDQSALLPVHVVPMEHTEFACTLRSTHPHDVRTLCIEDAEEISQVWIGYSQNWWTEVLKQRAQADPAAMLMTRVMLREPEQDAGFEANAAQIGAYVAEYAVMSLAHGGKEMPQWRRPEASPGESAAALAQIMQTQTGLNVCRPDFMPQIVALQDPIGLSSDINEIRRRRLQWAERRWRENSDEAHRFYSSSLLENVRGQLQESIQDDIFSHHGEARFSQIMTEAEYDLLEMRGMNKDYDWVPFPPGHPDAVDRNGQSLGRRILRTLSTEGGRSRWDEEVDFHVNATWERLFVNRRARSTGWLDDDGMRQWRQSFIERQTPFYLAVALYEKDWLAACTAPSADAYFVQHFDEDDPGGQTDICCAGEIYCRENVVGRTVDSLQDEEIQQKYLAYFLPPDPNAGNASLLRAFAANQSGVVERVFAMLTETGFYEAENGIDPGMADKTYALMAGALGLTSGRRFNWLKIVVAGYCAGILGSLSAVASQSLMVRVPGKLDQQVKKLMNLSLVQRAMASAIRQAGAKKLLDIPVLLNVRVSASDAMHLMYGVSYSKRDRQAMATAVARKRSVTLRGLSTLGEVEALVSAHQGKAGVGDLPDMQAPGASDQSRAGRAQADIARRAQAAGALLSQVSLAQLNEIYGGASRVARTVGTAAVMSSAAVRSIQTTDGKLAMGTIVVQMISLASSLATLRGLDRKRAALADPASSLSPAERKELEALDRSIRIYRMGMWDAGVGMVAGALDLMRLGAVAVGSIPAGSTAVVTASSARAAVMAAGLASLGAISAGLGAIVAGYKSSDEGVKGHRESAENHRNAALFSGISAFTFTGSALLYAVNAQAIRAAEQVTVSTATRVVGVLGGRAAVASIATAATPVGLVFLAVSLAYSVHAALAVPSELQKWVSRTPFGVGGTGEQRFGDFEEELQRFAQIVDVDINALRRTVKGSAEEREQALSGNEAGAVIVSGSSE